MKHRPLALCFAWLLALPSQAEELTVGLRANPSASAPTIDGRLEPDEWAAAFVTDQFVQVEPQAGAAPSSLTRLYLQRNDEFLFIALELEQSAPIVAREWVQGADLQGDDRVSIYLDPFSSGTSGYAFTVNPNGARSEDLIEDVDDFDEDWEDLWFAKAMRSERGWQLEIAIPFRSLSFPEGVDRWQINISRQIAAVNETIALTRRQRRLDLSASLPLHGMAGASAGSGLVLVATATAGRFRDYEADLRRDELEPSVDLFYKLTPSLTAAFTLNTDFSAAEVDQRELNLSRFELFFPERRDFFLRDANVFAFGGIEENGLPFFSRRIGLGLEGEPLDIQAGARLTGRIDQLSLGVMAVRQDIESASDRTTLGVARFRVDLAEHSTLGAILTRGNPNDGATDALYGSDYRFAHDEVLGDNELELYAWWQRSDTMGRTMTGADEDAFGFSLEWPNETIEARLAMADIGEDFAPPLGFINRSGIRDWQAEFRYRFRPALSGIRTIDSGLDLQLVDDAEGRLESRRQELSLLDIGTEAGDQIEFLLIRQFERLPEAFELTEQIEVDAGRYHFNRYGIGLQSAPQRPVVVGLDYETGDYLGGQLRSLSSSMAFSPHPQLNLGLDYELNELRFAAQRQTLRLARAFARYAFDSAWSATSLVQYDNESHELGLNARLRWSPTAGQEHFLVFNLGRVRDEDSLRYRRQSNEALVRLSFTFLF